MKLCALILAALMSGCSTVAGLNQQMLDQAKPTVMHDAEGRAWIWLQGMVPAVMMRAKELDAKP